jgi:hypothetical protein
VDKTSTIFKNVAAKPLTSRVFLKHEQTAQVVAFNHIRKQNALVELVCIVDQTMPVFRKEAMSLKSVRPKVMTKRESKCFASIALKEAGDKPVR